MIYIYLALVLLGLGCGFQYRFWVFLPIIILAVFASVWLWLYLRTGWADGVRILIFVQISLQCGYFIGVNLSSVIDRYRRPPAPPTH